MRELFKRFIKFVTDDYNEERKKAIIKMFNNSSTWPVYETKEGHIINGLTLHDVHRKVNSEVAKTDYSTVHLLLKELCTRQIITKSGVTKTGEGTLYRRLIWY